MNPRPLALFASLAILTRFVAAAPAEQPASPPKVPVVAMAEASLDPRDAILVDTRSRLEWTALRIPGARSLPPGAVGEGALLDLRSRTATKPALVFYGTRANDPEPLANAQKAVAMGFAGIYVLDAGINEWSARRPDRTLFFGIPFDSKEARGQTYDKDEFKKLIIEPAAFVEAAKSGKFQVLDIRGAGQRVPPVIPGSPIRFTPDDFLWNLSNDRLIQPRLILVADYDGSLNPLLHYYLARFGITDYRFLRGGQLALAESIARAAKPTPAPAPAATQSAPSPAAPAIGASPVPIAVTPAPKP